jgi:hypothetical protein
MKFAASAALLLAGAGIVACGSTSVAPRTAIAQLIRSSAAKNGESYVRVHSVRISKHDPDYAVADEWYGGATGPTGASTWILKRSGSTWRPTSVEYMFPLCSAAPLKVLKELVGGAGCYPPVGVYTRIYWTPGKSARLRYCQRPAGPGDFTAASAGVTCESASIVVYALESRCKKQGSCEAQGFRCRSYWNGRYGRTFEGVDHALCTDGRRRIEWDGG